MECKKQIKTIEDKAPELVICKRYFDMEANEWKLKEVFCMEDTNDNLVSLVTFALGLCASVMYPK